MVDCTDKIILVQAYEPEARSAVPEIEFFYADDRDKKVEEINVCVTAATIFFNSPPPLLIFPSLFYLNLGACPMEQGEKFAYATVPYR